MWLKMIENDIKYSLLIHMNEQKKDDIAWYSARPQVGARSFFTACNSFSRKKRSYPRFFPRNTWSI